MKKYVLDNGLTVILDKVNFFKSFTLGFWVKVGSAHESKSTNGYTHLLEHMLFKGTKKRSYFEISYEIENLGGYLNAFTTKEHTCFYANLLSDHQNIGLDVLWDMLNNSVIQGNELEKEKLVIVEEIKITQDNPDEVIYDIFADEFWKGYSQSYPILGSVENISLVKRENVFDFFKRYYIPENIVISIAGLFNEKLLLSQLKKLSKLSYKRNFISKQKSKHKIEESKISFNTYHHSNPALEQIYIILAFKAPSRKSKKRFPLFILSNILGEGSSSRLFVELREKKALCYSIYTFHNLNEYNGVLGISLSTGKDKYDDAVTSLFEEINVIIKNGITENELRKAKEQLKSSIIFAYESLETRMNINAKNELYYNRFINIDEAINNVNNVSLEEVNSLIKELLEDSSYSLVSLGNKT